MKNIIISVDPATKDGDYTTMIKAEKHPDGSIHIKEFKNSKGEWIKYEVEK